MTLADNRVAIYLMYKAWVQWQGALCRPKRYCDNSRSIVSPTRNLSMCVPLDMHVLDIHVALN